MADHGRQEKASPCALEEHPRGGNFREGAYGSKSKPIARSKLALKSDPQANNSQLDAEFRDRGSWHHIGGIVESHTETPAPHQNA